MDDARYGRRDKRGHWKPFKTVEYPTVFVWPVQPLGILRWLFAYPSYILPWNLLYAAVAVGVWMYLTPPVETLKTMAPGWIALRARAQPRSWSCCSSAPSTSGSTSERAQGSQFKYNPKWLATDNPAFLFRSQTADNMLWTLASGVPDLDRLRGR